MAERLNMMSCGTMPTGVTSAPTTVQIPIQAPPCIKMPVVSTPVRNSGMKSILNISTLQSAGSALKLQTVPPLTPISGATIQPAATKTPSNTSNQAVRVILVNGLPNTLLVPAADGSGTYTVSRISDETGVVTDTANIPSGATTATATTPSVSPAAGPDGPFIISPLLQPPQPVWTHPLMVPAPNAPPPTPLTEVLKLLSVGPVPAIPQPVVKAASSNSGVSPAGQPVGTPIRVSDETNSITDNVDKPSGAATTTATTLCVSPAAGPVGLPVIVSPLPPQPQQPVWTQPSMAPAPNAPLPTPLKQVLKLSSVGPAPTTPQPGVNAASTNPGVSPAGQPVGTPIIISPNAPLPTPLKQVLKLSSVGPAPATPQPGVNTASTIPGVSLAGQPVGTPIIISPLSQSQRPILMQPMIVPAPKPQPPPPRQILVSPPLKLDSAPLFVPLTTKPRWTRVRSGTAAQGPTTPQVTTDVSSAGLCPAPGTKPILSTLLKGPREQAVESLNQQKLAHTNVCLTTDKIQGVHPLPTTITQSSFANCESQDSLKKPTGLGFVKLGESPSAYTYSPFLNVSVSNDGTERNNSNDPPIDDIDENDLGCELGLKIGSVYSLAEQTNEAFLAMSDESPTEPPGCFTSYMTFNDEETQTSSGELTAQGTEEDYDDMNPDNTPVEHIEQYSASDSGSLSPEPLCFSDFDYSSCSDDESYETETSSETDSILGRGEHRGDSDESGDDQQGQEDQEVARDRQMEQAIIRTLMEDSDTEKTGIRVGNGVYQHQQLDNKKNNTQELGISEAESPIESMHDSRPIEREELLDAVLEKIIPDMVMPDAVSTEKVKACSLLSSDETSVLPQVVTEPSPHPQDPLAPLVQHDHTYASSVSLDTSCELHEDGGISISGQILLKVTPVSLDSLYLDPVLQNVSRGPLPYSVERMVDDNPLNLMISNVVSLNETHLESGRLPGFAARNVLSENTLGNVSPHWDYYRSTTGQSRIPKRLKKTRKLIDKHPITEGSHNSKLSIEGSKKRTIPHEPFDPTLQCDENEPLKKRRNVEDSPKKSGGCDGEHSPTKLWRLKRKIKSKLKLLKKQFKYELKQTAMRKQNGMSRTELWRLQHGSNSDLNRVVFQSGILYGKPRKSEGNVASPGKVPPVISPLDGTRQASPRECPGEMKETKQQSAGSPPDYGSPRPKGTKLIHVFKIEMNREKEKSVTFISQIKGDGLPKGPPLDDGSSRCQPVVGPDVGSDRVGTTESSMDDAALGSGIEKAKDSLEERPSKPERPPLREDQHMKDDPPSDCSSSNCDTLSDMRDISAETTSGCNKNPKEAEFVGKRPRGRPRKIKLDLPSLEPPEKRPRGRPGSSKQTSVIQDNNVDTSRSDIHERSDTSIGTLDANDIPLICDNANTYKTHPTDTVSDIREISAETTSGCTKNPKEGEFVGKRPRGRPRKIKPHPLDASDASVICDNTNTYKAHPVVDCEPENVDLSSLDDDRATSDRSLNCAAPLGDSLEGRATDMVMKKHPGNDSKDTYDRTPAPSLPIQNQHKEKAPTMDTEPGQTVQIVPLQSEQKEIAINSHCREKVQLIYMPPDLQYQRVDCELKDITFRENCDIQGLNEFLPSRGTENLTGANIPNGSRVTDSCVDEKVPSPVKDDTIPPKDVNVTLATNVHESSSNKSESGKLSRIERLKAMLKAQEEALVVVRQKREESRKIIDSIDLI